MVSFRHLLILAATAPAALSLTIARRDASTLSADIQALDQSVLDLTKTTNSWDGGKLGAVPIVAGILKVHLANRKGFNDAHLSAPLSMEESKALLEQVRKSLVVDIPISIKATIDKKPLFVAAGMTDEVKSGLMRLKDDHETFSAALAEKLSSGGDPAAQGAQVGVVKFIDDTIQSGITAFSS